MPRALRAEDDDADELRSLIDERKTDLGHLRVRRRAEVLTLESGPEKNAIPHARFRRVSKQYWVLECATHTGRWEPTGFRDTLERLFELLTTTFPWAVASYE